MNCRDFQNEFGERAGLSDAATLHFKDCADCEKLHREQSQIWQMIESLPEVAAPADFNYKFRARVATAKASDFRPAWWKSLRYVVPIFAAVLVLTMVFASQNFFVSTPQPDQILVEKTDDSPNLINDDVQAKPPSQEVASADANYENANFNASTNELNSTPKIEQTSAPTVIADSRNTGKKDITPKKVDDSGGGVKDFGVDTAPPPILPSGFPTMENKRNTNSNEMMSSNGQNVESLLSFLGVETTAENGKLRVTSVKSGSIPARSGLKIGDIIETIDGKSVSGSDRITTAKTLTILRGNERTTITFQTQ